MFGGDNGPRPRVKFRRPIHVEGPRSAPGTRQAFYLFDDVNRSFRSHSENTTAARKVPTAEIVAMNAIFFLPR